MRVLALALPDLACELAALARESALGMAGALTLQAPLAVVVAGRGEGIGETSILSAVTARARRCGVFPGQRVADAHTLVADLDVRRVDPADVDAALARVAEMALAFGPVVAFEGPDTVWVDVSGTAHLVGGEEALVAQLCERVRSLGHRVRGAIASGPSVAQALARYSPIPQTVVPPGRDAQAFAPMPVRALPLDDDTLAWLLRLGVVTVSDLAQQPRGPLGNRLGPLASRILPLLDGDDPVALSPYHPPVTLSETIEWDDAPVEGVEPLLFALRGLLARLCARLEGRGGATRAVVLTLTFDRAVEGARERSLRLDLAAPLAHAADLVRVLRPKLEALACPAPLTSLTLSAPELTRAPRPQLSLDGRSQAPEDIGLVLAELSAELGEGRVGVLAARNSHVPEECTRLEPASLAEPRSPGPGGAAAALLLWGDETRGVEPPTRLLPKPAPVRGKLVEGGTVSVNDTPFRVEHLERLERLENVNWWTGTSTSRDYARAWLVSSQGGAEAWLMRDRRKGGLYVHGWYV
ncbi:MAG: DNA polymerase Y family protein [Polyangiaceae bacterium]|jgi:protein ImuB|nr:DNA polymerase Y family protein [Polyangiaceae bacterium]